MRIHYSLSVLVAAATLVSSGYEAHAAKALFKGVAVITARTAITACTREYSIGESFVVLYRANVGAEATPETAMALGSTGGLLLTSDDATPKLTGAGTVRIDGAAYGVPFSTTHAPATLQTTPAAVLASTQFVTMTGTVNNLGIVGCHVTFRAGLALLPPGGF
jgi:hypothetical protein